MQLEEKLKELGLILPQATKPGGNYVSVNVRNNIAYVAIQFPFFNGNIMYKGRLGNELTTQDGYKAMQYCALNVVAQMLYKVGLENIEGLNHMDAYYQAADEWDEAPKVVDGASDVFVNLLGERGIHSRSIFGVHKLPRNFPVGIQTSFTLV